MSLENFSKSSPAPSPAAKPTTSLASGTLTNSEIESLRQRAKEADGLLREEFRKLLTPKRAA